jgi:hypothetical protein
MEAMQKVSRTVYVTLPKDLSADDARLVLNGGERDRRAVRDLLTRRSDLVKILGTRAADVERSILEFAFRDEVVPQETARREMQDLRARLSQPGDGCLERLLVEQVVLCWLALTSAQEQRAYRMCSELDATIASHWDRHVSRLSSDFLRACRTLAMVRRFHSTPVQVNIADQQVNVSR